MLHLAQGHKPRRPQSRPIDDELWEFIEHCWAPVQGRPSAERLVISILVFLRTYLHLQPFCGMPMSSERNNPQFTMSEPLLSPPNIEQLPPNVSLPHLQRKPLAHTVPDDDGGNEAVPQPDCFQSTLETLNQSESIVTTVMLGFPF